MHYFAGVFFFSSSSNNCRGALITTKLSFSLKHIKWKV